MAPRKAAGRRMIAAAIFYILASLALGIVVGKRLKGRL